MVTPSQFYDSTFIVPHTFQNLPCNDYSFIIHDNNNCTHPDNQNITISIPIPFTNTITNNSPTLISDVQGAYYQWLDCNNNNSPITGETNQSYTAQLNGDYAVEVTKSNCTDVSPCESVNNVGININNKINYFLYPNPNDGKFVIERNSADLNSEIIIYNLSGKKIISDTWEVGDKKIMDFNLF